MTLSTLSTFSTFSTFSTPFSTPSARGEICQPRVQPLLTAAAPSRIFDPGYRMVKEEQSDA
ncbi:MAG: hypothetical protein V3T83_17905, partial [Acidobacteriota bacterium]